MKILAIESSCDETAASVVEDGRKVLSGVIASQVSEHIKFGGVVPEIASRRHAENISAVVNKALSDAELTLDDIDAIAVTYAPGLIGALLVGVNYAKALNSSVTGTVVSSVATGSVDAVVSGVRSVPKYSISCTMPNCPGVVSTGIQPVPLI